MASSSNTDDDRDHIDEDYEERKVKLMMITV